MVDMVDFLCSKISSFDLRRIQPTLKSSKIKGEIGFWLHPNKTSFDSDLYPCLGPKKLKVEHDEELNGHFFSEQLKFVSHDELMRICQDRSYDPAPDAVKTLTDFVGQLEDDPPVMDLFTSIF